MKARTQGVAIRSHWRPSAGGAGRAALRICAAALMLAVLAACGQSPGPTAIEPTTPATVAAAPTEAPTVPPTAVASAPAWRFVNSGWAELDADDAPGVFVQELRAFVITGQPQLDEFNRGFTLRRGRGTSATLGNVEFSDSILLAAYYLWRPLQGDPLSVVGLTVNGTRATVELRLDESAQGRKYPYLMAPMTMVAVDREMFPLGTPLEFEFLLNGEPAAMVSATVP